MADEETTPAADAAGLRAHRRPTPDPRRRMSRKERLAAKHAAGRGKGHATPRNTPGGMTRNRQGRLLARRSEHAIKKGDGIERIQQTIRDGAMAERDALELLLREAGGIILDKES